MSPIVRKVTAFITQRRCGTDHLLLFRHPTAGIQIPAGTVEDGESPEAAALREAREETGLQNVHIERYLGCWANELQAGECIIARAVVVRTERDLRSPTRERQLSRGLTVQLNSVDDAFANVTYIEYDRYPDPQYTILNVTGWVPVNCVSMCKERHFFLLSCEEQTPEEWSLSADQGHIFQPFWARMDALPRIVEPQARWLPCLRREDESV
jgi:8-oxo-dGTP pyrophosphatase MutT (NUDIX family)